MKTVIFTIALSLLFACDVKGQSELRIWDEQIEPIQIITLNELIEYKKHCYNDSTLFSKNEGKSYIEIQIEYEDYLPCNIYVFQHYFYSNSLTDQCGNEYLYLHKQPTFEGFIEWMEANQ